MHVFGMRTKVAAAGLGVIAAGLLAPAPAQAASSCSGPSGNWICYSTTGTKTAATTVMRSWVLENTTSKKVTARCNVTMTTSFASSSTQSVSASVKAGLFAVAEATVTGTQTFTNTLTVSEAAGLEFNFTLNPHETRVCQLTHGYYKVGTKYEVWNNYKVTTKTGTTTVPYQWGLRLA